MFGAKTLLLGSLVVYTLCFTFYLYWKLVHNSVDTVVSTIVPKHLNFPPHSINDVGWHGEKHSFKDNGKQQYLDKLQRYKKEQKWKKISRKLIDELQPIESLVNGKLVLMHPHKNM